MMCEWFLPELNEDGLRGALDLPHLREAIENMCRCYMDAAGLKNARRYPTPKDLTDD